MKSVIPWIALLAFAPCSACARKSPTPEARTDAGSHISAAETRFEFGAAAEGDNIKHTFVLRNTGAVPVKLDRVEPNCPCVTATVKQQLIGPGDSTEVEVSLDTLGRPGDLEKNVAISSSELSAPPVKLRIHARVEPLLAVHEEDDESAEDMYFGATVTREAWITGARASVAQLTIERVTSPDVTAEIVKKTEGDSVRQQLRVTVRGTALGHYHGAVIMKTDLPQKPKLVHGFEWNVLGNLKVNPRALHFETSGGLPVVGGEEKVALIKSRLDGFDVKGAKSSSAVFKPSVRRTDTQGVYELRVVVADRKRLAETATAMIELSTNDKVQPVITVPISVASALPPRPPAPAASSARPQP